VTHFRGAFELRTSPHYSPSPNGSRKETLSVFSTVRGTNFFLERPKPSNRWRRHASQQAEQGGISQRTKSALRREPLRSADQRMHVVGRVDVRCGSLITASEISVGRDLCVRVKGRSEPDKRANDFQTMCPPLRRSASREPGPSHRQFKGHRGAMSLTIRIPGKLQQLRPLGPQGESQCASLGQVVTRQIYHSEFLHNFATGATAARRGEVVGD